MSENYFTKLFDIDVSKKTEKKGGLTYLSWAWAWAELKKLHPDAEYTVYENAEGWNYHTDGKTCWVKTGVKVEHIEHIEYLPVMDFKNRSIPAEQVTSFDVNKAIQRSLTKAIGRHGLGLYIYAGEDLPEETAPQGQPVDREKLNTLASIINKNRKDGTPYFSEERKKHFRELAKKDVDQCLKDAEIALEELESAE
jgi:hypothetical protein